MSKYSVKFLFVLMMCVVSFSVYAQSSCDKLFANGVKLQQTMTISSQKKAINFFEKAKACYDSQAKKDLCDEQIKSCRNIIAQISKTKEEEAKKKETENTPKEEEKTTKELEPQKKEAKRNIQLSLEETYVKFKGKGDEFKKVKVNCNYPDWKITEQPVWTNCSRNENNEIVIEVERNPNKEERSGILRVECGDKIVTLTIIQKKLNILERISDI